MTNRKPFFASRRYMLSSVAFATLTVLAIQASADPQLGEIGSARSQAQTLAAQGDCREALAIQERVAIQSGQALDFVAAGECAVRIGDTQRAAENFWQASERRAQLDEPQTLYVLRSLAYQAEAAGQTTRARLAWDAAANRSGEATDRVMAARSARLDGRSGVASAQLAQIDPSTLQGATLATFYEEKARCLRDQQPNAAALYYARAIEAEDAVYRRFEYALILDEMGQYASASDAFAAALAGDPDNVDIVLAAAYSARRGGRDAQAAQYFERALVLDPSRRELQEDLGYAYKDADDEAAAAGSFRLAIDRLSEDPIADEVHTYRLRREVEQLERNHYGYTFLSYRDGTTSPGPNLPELGPTESQIGGEFGWRPDALNGQATGLTFYGRGYASLGGDEFRFDNESLQLGVGARWKPFADYDLNLAAERLIAGGDLARDGWLLRASAGWSDGLDWNPVAPDWNYTSVYGDIAYIPDSPAYLSAYVSARQGRRFRTGDGWAVTPYVVGVAQVSDDSFQTRERVEVGTGVAISYWFDDDRYRAHRQRVDFELEYRFGVGDQDEDAAMARVIWTF